MNINDKTKEIDLGNGLRLTESHDMGIFLHFKSESGNQKGKAITPASIGYTWATELLAKLEQEQIKK